MCKNAFGVNESRKIKSNKTLIHWGQQIEKKHHNRKKTSETIIRWNQTYQMWGFYNSSSHVF